MICILYLDILLISLRWKLLAIINFSCSYNSFWIYGDLTILLNLCIFFVIDKLLVIIHTFAHSLNLDYFENHHYSRSVFEFVRIAYQL